MLPRLSVSKKWLRPLFCHAEFTGLPVDDHVAFHGKKFLPQRPGYPRRPGLQGLHPQAQRVFPWEKAHSIALWAILMLLSIHSTPFRFRHPSECHRGLYNVQLVPNCRHEAAQRHRWSAPDGFCPDVRECPADHPVNHGRIAADYSGCWSYGRSKAKIYHGIIADGIPILDSINSFLSWSCLASELPVGSGHIRAMKQEMKTPVQPRAANNL